jgi:hypothetical protein
VEVIAAPSREAEVRYATRSIKKLLLDGHPTLSNRLTGDRQASLPAAGWRSFLGVWRAYPGGRKPYWQPAIAQLVNLLSLYPDFPWRQTMDALRSPYFRQPWLSAQQVDLLDQLTRQRPVVAGRDQWAYALQPSKALGESVDDDERRVDYLVNQLSPPELQDIESGLFYL